MSIFNKEGLRALKDKADSFRNSEGINMKDIPTFYRNKPSAYFEEIKEKYDNVMHPYLKDDNGDKHCPLNRRIRGLFYMGRRDKTFTSQLSKYFLFGNKRVIVPVNLILNNQSRLYFCDFWCHRKEHYVTIAVTKMGTEADDFCQMYLLELDKNYNRYLELNGSNVSINQNIWVEVFCTEQLDLKHDGITWDSGSCPRQSRPNGLPKNFTCSTCNLVGSKVSYLTTGPSKTTQEMSINRVPVLPEFMTNDSSSDDEQDSSVKTAVLCYSQTSSMKTSLEDDTQDSSGNGQSTNSSGSLFQVQNNSLEDHSLAPDAGPSTSLFGSSVDSSISKTSAKKRSLEDDTQDSFGNVQITNSSDEEPPMKKRSLEEDQSDVSQISSN